MKILLPPSEGKTPAAPGEPSLDFATLLYPQLQPQRELVMAALAEVSASPDALSRLKVGASLADVVAENISLADAAAAEAHTIYTGVLFQALDYPSLNAQAQAWADENIWVSSALFGLLRLADRIPAYRLSMDVNLGSFQGSSIGGLATFWKKTLTEATAEVWAEQLIVDCRSAAYAKSLPAPAQRSISIDVFSPTAGGLKKVSHHAKHYRGVVARVLAQESQAAEACTSVEELAALINRLCPEYDVELFAPKKTTDPMVCGLILPG